MAVIANDWKECLRYDYQECGNLVKNDFMTRNHQAMSKLGPLTQVREDYSDSDHFALFGNSDFTIDILCHEIMELLHSRLRTMYQHKSRRVFKFLIPL